MVDAAKADEPSPHIEAYIMALCMTFGCLPSQIMKEDAVLINKMLVDRNIMQAMQKLRGSVGAEIHNLPPETSRILQEVSNMGIDIWGL